MMNNILTVAWKELQLFFKDRPVLVVLFVLPLLLASLMGSINQAVNQSMSEEGKGEALLSAYLVNLDEGEYGQQIEDVLKDTSTLKIIDLTDTSEADRLVGEGEAMVAIIIPDGFSEDVNSYIPADIRVIVDPVQQDFGNIIIGIMNNLSTMIVLQGEVKYGVRTVLAESGVLEGAPADVLAALEAQSFGAVMTELGRLESDAQISVDSQKLSGEAVDTSWNPFTYYIPAFTVMFAFFLVGTVGATMLTEKEEGSLRRLLASPISRAAIIGGKMMAYMLVICLQVVILFGVGNGIFGMPLGDVPTLIVMTLVLAFTSTSLGMLVAAISRSRQQADSTGMILGFVLAGLGGCIFPFYNVEGFMGILSRFTPHAHAVIAFADVLNGDAVLLNVLPQVGILAAFGVFFFSIALWRFKFE